MSDNLCDNKWMCCNTFSLDWMDMILAHLSSIPDSLFLNMISSYVLGKWNWLLQQYMYGIVIVEIFYSQEVFIFKWDPFMKNKNMEDMNYVVGKCFNCFS